MAQKGKQKQSDPPPAPEDEGDDDGGEEEAPLTRGEVIKLVNGVVGKQLARKLPAAIEAGMKPLFDRLGALGAKEDDEDADEDEDHGEVESLPAKGKEKGKADPAMLKLMKQLNKLKQEIKERDDRLTKEAEARKAQTIESELTKALTEIGVDKNRLRGALAIHKATATIDEETGNVIFRVRRDGYDEELEPAVALREWADTEEGKSYLAPVGSSGGAGARPPRNPGPGRKPPPNSPEAKAERTQQAKTDLLGAVSQLVAGGSIAIE
jgi:hypothetical protein